MAAFDNNSSSPWLTVGSPMNTAPMGSMSYQQPLAAGRVTQAGATVPFMPTAGAPAPVPTATAPAPVNGWGLAGSPYSARYSARAANTEGPPAADGSIFNVKCGPSNEPLGFSFAMFEDGPEDRLHWVNRVTEVEAGSWAEKNGVQVGCTIFKFNGENVVNTNTQQLQDKIKNVRPFELVLKRPLAHEVVETAHHDYEAAVNWAPWQHHSEHHQKKHAEEHGPAYEDHFSMHVDRHHSKVQIDHDDVHKALFYLPETSLKMFPSMFLMFTLAMFVMPIFLVWYIGEDVNSQKWLPHITQYVLLLPVLYIVTFFAHLWKGGPSRFFITLSLIGSAVMLLVIANIILLQTYEKGPMFSSTADCMSWGEKRDLQKEWEFARTYYANCMNQTAVHEHVPFAAASFDLRMQDCPGYDQQLVAHPDWRYLEYLEVYQKCGGWCTPSPQIWAKEHVRDACSPVVAAILHDKVGWVLKQVTVYSIFTLLATSAILLGLPPVLKKYGMEW